MKKAIVLGGAGFIGTWMCQKLKDENYYVIAIDRKMPEFGYAPADEYHVFDLRNSVDYWSNLPLRDTDELYQFAAEMGGAQYVFTGDYDAEIMSYSAKINLNTLDACVKWNIPKVFFASSACVYPSLGKEAAKDGIACRESFAGNPDSPYGMEKLWAESLYDAYARNYCIDCKVGRFHNVFGEYGTWRGGREKAPAALMRKIAEAGQGGRIECFGDGEQTRSFLHVSEAVEGVVRLMASGFTGPVNIGSSEMVPINQMITMIKQIAGIHQLLVDRIPGPIGVQGRNSDNSLIFEKLGWKPTMSLKEGLERTYPWIAEQVAKAKALTAATL